MKSSVTRANQSRSTPCLVANRVAPTDPKSPFRLPEDGWWQVLSIGEFPARWEGGALDGEAMVQCIDAQAIASIKANFDAKVEAETKEKGQFAGLLVDYDHFSHNPNKPSEAACWVFELDARENGLWARGRWTSTGEQKVVNGDYRFASGVLSGFQWVDGERYRPTCLDRIALTNDPRIKTLAPITVPNRDTQPSKTMNDRLILTELLGLAANADDAAITNGVATLRANIATHGTTKTELADVKNRLAEAEKTTKTLGERVTKLNADLVDRDMAEYDSVIEDKEAIKTALTTNRDGTIGILKGLKLKTANAASSSAQSRANRKPVYNREEIGGRNPGPVDGDKTEAEKEALMRKVANRRGEILKSTPRIGFQNATLQAVREIEIEEQKELVPKDA